MSAIPPKHTPESPAYDAPESESGMVAVYNAASHANAESFPVLKAFQDYLEAERTQARKRVTQLSIFFAILMGVVVTGFLTAGIFMLRNMTSMQNKLLDVALAAKTAPAPAPAPAAAAPSAPAHDDASKQLTRLASELQTNLGQKLDGVSAIASQMNEKVASQSGELETLRSELRRMQEQSAKLSAELNAVKEDAKRPVPAPAVAVAAAPAPKPQPAAVVKPKPAPVPPKPAPALTALPKPAPAVTVLPKPTPPPRDPRFPPATKEPPVTPAGVTAPAAPKDMMATAVQLKTKNVGTIPWRVLIPE